MKRKPLKMIIFRGFRHIPQGGFEPPQAEPESAVLPLHNRGKLTEGILSYITTPCQEYALHHVKSNRKR